MRRTARPQVDVLEHRLAPATGTVQYVLASSPFSESTVSATIAVQLVTNIAPLGAGGISVDVQDTLGGAATSGADYTAFPNTTVAFTNADPFTDSGGQRFYTPKTVAVSLIDDRLVESTSEVISFGLTNIQQGTDTITAGAQATHLLVITDNESATVTIPTATTTVAEGGTSNIVATLTITAIGSGSTQLAIGVSANLPTGNADYTPTAVTFPATSLSGATANLVVAGVDDRLVEAATENITGQALAITSTGANVTASGTQTIAVTDNESAVVSISPGTTTVAEGGASQNVVATLAITATGTGSVELAVPISASLPGNADYAAAAATFAIASIHGAAANVVVSAVNDTLLEGPESFAGQPLAITSSGGANVTAAGTQTISVTDNESATLSILTPITVTEAGGAQNVGVTLTITGTGTGTFALGSGVTLTADVTQSGGTATSASDYTAFGTQTVTFSGGAGTGAVQNTSLTVLEDVLLEGPETVLLTLGNLNAAGTSTTLGTTANTTTITDNESATLNIATPVTVTEAGGAQNIGVTLSITGTGAGTFALGTGITLTADVTQSGGTASSGSDYTAFGTQAVTFSGGAATGTVQNTTLTVLEDTLLEGPETVLLTLGNLGAGGTATTLGTTANTTTITDNESATLNIATPVTVTEAGGAQNIGVTLTITGTGTGTFALGSGITLTANVTQTGGTATSGSDYSAFGTQIVSFSGGAPTGTVQNTTLTVLEDTLLEGPETVLLTLGNLGAGGTATTLGTTANATTITDNESATLSIAPSATATEAGGAQSIGVTLTITGSGSGTFALGSGVTLTADVTQTGGAATSGSDYSGFGTQTVTFTGGAATGTVQNASLAVLEDTLLEGPETVLLALGNLGAGGTAATLGATANTTTITDNESATLSIVTPVSVTEAGGSQNIGVTLTITGTGTGTFALGSGITLTADVVDAGGGSAASGSDYSAFSTQTVTFSGGAPTGATQNASLGVLNDQLVEAPETVLLTLQNLGAGGTATTLGNTANTTTITDNDTYTVSIAGGTTNVTEGGATQNVTVTLTLTADSVSGTGTLAPGVSVSANLPGNADYGSTAAVFNPGAVSGNTADIVVSATDDRLLETTTETFVSQALSATSTATQAPAASGSQTVVVTDNESASLSIATPITATEAGGAQNIGVTLTITGSGTGTFALGSGITLTADVTQTGGTATSSIDYTAFGTQTVTFTGGAATGAVQNTSLTVLEDVLLEGPETVLLTLGNLNAAGTSTTLGTTANTTTITDNESATLSIATPVTVTEAGGAQNIGVTLTITGTGTGTFALGSGITLTADVTQAGGTAISGSDYTPFTTQTVTFSGGAATGSVQNTTLTVLEDTLLEGPETVLLTLGNLGAGGTATTLGTTANTTTITDNESATLDIATPVTVTEAGGAQNIGVTLTITGTGTGTFALGSGITLTADVTQAGGTATSGSDYTAFGTQTVTFTGGAATGTVQNTTLTVLEDTLLEGPETVLLTLGNLGTGGTATTLGTTANTTTITDNESATLNIATPVTATEAGGAQNIGVTLTITGAGTGTFALGSGITLTADVTQTGGTATSGSDFTAFGTQTVTFTGGAATGTVQNTTLTVLEDTLLEGPETVLLTLGNLGANGTATTLGTTANTTTITDNESATLNISTPVTVTEAGGAQNIGVTLTIAGTGTGTFALGSGVTLTADVTRTGGTATSGSDFTAFGTQTVTFSGGATTASVQNTTLTVLEDTLLEGPETVLLTLGNLGAGGTATTLGTTANTTTITDNENATLSIATPVTVTEAGGAQNIGVTLTITGSGVGTFALGSGITLTADVTQTGGTATSGSDYTPFGTQTVTFTGGAATGTVQNASLNVINDTVVEGPETVLLTLGNLNAGGTATTLGTTANTTTITDNDTAQFTFAAATSSATEGGPNATVGVTLTITGNGSPGVGTLGANVSVNLAGPGSGVDYTLPASPMVAFASGSSSGTQNVVIPAVNDTLVEPSETFALSFTGLNDPTGQVTTLGTNNLTITDNDFATVSIVAGPIDVTEGGPSANVTVTLAITANGTPGLGSLGVAVSANLPGNADYTATPVTFAAGSTNGATSDIVVSAVDDRAVEPFIETFTGQALLVTANGGANVTVAGTSGTRTINVTDNDRAVVTYSGTANVTEGSATPATVTATLSLVTLGTGPIQLDTPVTAAVNSATNDFSGTTVLWNAGETPSAKTIAVVATDDRTVEETVEALSGNLVVNSAATIEAAGAALVNVTDNDSATVSIDAGTTTVIEGGAAQNVVVTLALVTSGTGPASLGVPITADLPGNADYSTTAAVFGAGSTGGTANIVVSAVNDTIVEGPESFSGQALSANSVANVTPAGARTIAVTDNDSAAITFAAPTSSVSEGATALVGVTLTITANGVPGAGTLSSAVTVDLAGGSPADITLPTTPAVTFASGSSTSTQNASVGTVDDRIVEAVESFVLSFTNLTDPSGQVSSSGAHTLNVTDNDSASVSIVGGTTTVAEGGVSQNVVATLTLTTLGTGTEQLGVAVTANLPGNADYSATGVTFGAGSTTGATANVVVNATDDRLVEATTETFAGQALAITSTGGAAVTATGSQTIAVTDNDSASVSIAGGATTVAEGGVSQNVAATLTLSTTGSGAEQLDVAVSANLPGNTDYVATAANFAAGSITGATSNVVVSAVDDRRVEVSTETFAGQALAMTSTGGAAVTATGAQTIAVNDNDSASVSLAGGITTVAEGGGSQSALATLTITSTGSGTEQLDVAVSANLPGNADYSATAASFGVGSATGATSLVTISAIDDQLVEVVTETFASQALAITSSGGATVAATGAQTIAVTDNDSASVSVAGGTTTVAEGGVSQNAIATLTLNTTGSGTAQLDVAVSANLPGNADYSVTAASFGVGSTSGATANVVVSAIDDRLVEASTETFAGQALAITSTGGAAVAATGSQTIDVTDNDSASVSIAGGTTTVTEGGVSQNVGATLTLTTSGSGAEQLDVAVSANLPGNADYVATAAGFAAGSITGATANVVVSAVDDRRVEAATETFAGQALAISSSGGAAVTATGSQTIAVNDNDSASVSIPSGITVMAEGGSSQSVLATLTITAAGSGTEQLDVAVSANLPGNADYSATAASFGVGSATGATSLVTVNAINDRSVEAITESFANQALAITSSGGANVTAGGLQTVAVIDNDSASISVAGGTTTVAEGGVSQNAIATLTLNTTGTGTVQLDVPVSANLPGNTDYSATAASFGIGSTSGATANVIVSAINDRLVEVSTETFAGQALAITSTGGAAVTATGSQTIAVIDNDSATISIAGGTTTVAEGGVAQNVIATLTLSTTGSGAEQLDVAVSANLSGNADYVATAASFAAGSITGATANVVVSAVDDRLVEATTETFAGQALAIASSGGAAVTATGSQTIAVNDNDSASVSIPSGITVVAEGGSSQSVLATLTIAATGSGTEQLDVAISANLPGNADYSATAASFSVGSATGATSLVGISATDDQFVEATTETFTNQDLTITSSGGATVTAAGTQTIAVTDNDSASISISGGATTVAEGGISENVNATLTLNTTGTGTAQLEVAVSANLAGNADYDATAATFGIGSTTGATADVIVSAIDDRLVEASTESFAGQALAITSTGGTAVTATGSQTIDVTDNDSASISIAGGTTTVAEGGVAQDVIATLTLSTTGSGTEQLDVAVSANLPGNADYAATAASFAAGSITGATANVVVSAVDDRLVEATTETFAGQALAISSSGGAAVTATGSQTIAVNDNDSASVSIPSGITVVAEGGSSQSVLATLTITAAGSGTEQLDVAVSANLPGNADYSATAASFGVGSATGATSLVTVNAINDRSVEAITESFANQALAITSSGGANVTAGGLQTVAVIDNDSATISIAGGTTSVAEGGVSQNAIATLTLNTTGTGTVQLDVPVSANLPGNADYSATAASFGVGSTTGATANVIVSAVDDRLVEASTETFAGQALFISSTGGAGVIATGSQTIAVTDNDIASVSIAGGTTTVAEGGAAQNVIATLTLSTTGSGAEQLDVAVSANLPGNADYGATAASFAAGSITGATANVVVSAVDDRRVEATTETFAGQALAISSSGGAAVTATGSRTVAVTDNDSASVSIPSGITVVAEGGSSQSVLATLTITATGSGTEQLDVAVSANLPGNADYSATAASFGVGSATGATSLVTVSAIDDRFVEAITDTFTNQALAITSSGGATVTASGTQTVAVIDNDSATIGIAGGTTTVAEGGVSQNVIATLTLNTTGTGTAQLDVAVSANLPGNADYSATAVGFGAGSVTGATANVAVSAINDRLVEASTETFAGQALAVTSTGGAAVTATGSQTIAVTDNDSASVSIAGGTTTVAEGGVAQNVIATLTLSTTGSGAEQLDVAVGANLPGNADYGATAASFAAGSITGATANVVVSAVDDRRVEATTETFAGQALAISSSGGAAVAATGSRTVAVTDNDSASVSIPGGITVVAEGGGSQFAVATLTITATGSGTEQLDVAVSANLPGNGDYSATAASFSVGSASGATANVTVNAIDDRRVEAITETFASQALAITSSGGAAVTATGSQTVAVIDNESASVATTGATTAAEGGVAQNAVVTLAITAVGSGAEQLDVPVSANLPGNADYLATAATFGVGSTSGATANVVVSAVDDRRVEASTETFAGEALSITSTGGAGVIATGSQAIGVLDNDSASVGIAAGVTTVAEGGASQNVVATLTLNTVGSGLEQLDVAVSANLPGNADYSASAASFSAGATSGATANVSVSALDDRRVEASTETFAGEALAITATGEATVAATGTQTIAVTDNDSATVGIAGGATTVAEGGAAQNVTATLTLITTGAGAEQLDVAVSASLPGNADYTAAAASFGAGSIMGATSNVAVSAVDDRRVEAATETFASQALAITSSGGAVVSATGSQSIAVTDNDSASIAVAAGTTTAAEGGASQNVVATLTLTTSGAGTELLDVAVDANLPGNADYAATAASFAPGATTGATANVGVSAVDDRRVEASTETFAGQALAITSTGGAAVAAAGSRTITVTDNDSATVSIPGGTTLVTEGSGALTVPAALTLTTTGSGAAQLDVALSANLPGNADYNSTAAGFAVGSTSGATANVTVLAVNDGVIEGTETFMGQALAITSSGGANATASGFRAIVVADNPTPGLPITDPFNRPDGALGSPWTVRNGSLVIAGARATPGAGATVNGNLATLNGPSALDVTVQANVSFTAVGQSIGLVARYLGSGDSNMYLANVTAIGGSTVQATIFRNLGGAWTALASAAVNTVSNALLEFKVVGSSLQLFVGGTLAAFAKDSSIASAGTVGIRTDNGTSLDNFSAGAAAGPLAYTDAFNASPPGNQLRPTWNVSAGAYSVAASLAVAQTGGVNLATLDGVNLADADVQANVLLAAVGQHTGLVARHTGPGDSNMYMGDLEKVAGGFQARIFVNLGGSFTQLAATGVIASANTLRFKVAGNQLQLFVDGNLVLNITDNNITGPGSVGLRAFGTVGYDNFQVS